MPILQTVASGQSTAITWREISGPYGFKALYELNDGTLFGRNEDLLVRSIDGGTTWENFQRPGGPIYEFAVGGSSMVIAVSVYIPFRPANWKHYFLSTDAGNSWERINTEGIKDTVHHNIMISEGGDVYGLYGSGSRVVVERIIDGLWYTVSGPSSVPNYPLVAGTAYTVSGLDVHQNIFIGTRIDGIHSSRDGGITWTRDLNYRHVSALAFAPDGRVVLGNLPNGRTAGGVFSSSNEGLTWDFLGLTDVNIFSIQVDSSGSIFVVTGSGIFRNMRDSAGWEELGPFDNTYEAFRITRSNRYLVTSAGYGFLASTDGGETWYSDGVRSQDIYSLTSTSRGSILAGTIGRGLLRSTDGGLSWSHLHGPDVPDYFYTLSAAPGRVIAGTSKGLFSSVDDGVQWSLLTGALNHPDAEMPVYSVLEHPAGTLYIGTGVGIYRSNDGGRNWIASGLQATAVHGLAADDGGTIFAATRSMGVFRSTDNGADWVYSGLDRPDIQTLEVNAAGRIFVGVANGVIISNDAGITWSEKTFVAGHVYSLIFNGNFDVYAGTSGGIYSSSDGGQSWGYSGLGDQRITDLAYDTYHYLMAGAFDYGVFRSEGIITAVGNASRTPDGFIVTQNYPNPFNPTTRISFTIPEAGRVTLSIYDILGRQIANLINERKAAGEYAIDWNAESLPGGVYFYRLVAGKISDTKKMILTR